MADLIDVDCSTVVLFILLLSFIYSMLLIH